MEIGKTNAFFGQLVDMGRVDLLVAIRGQVTVPQIICHYNNDIGFVIYLSGGCKGCY
jgi:hypothetical protein